MVVDIIKKAYYYRILDMQLELKLNVLLSQTFVFPHDGYFTVNCRDLQVVHSSFVVFDLYLTVFKH